MYCGCSKEESKDSNLPLFFRLEMRKPTSTAFLWSTYYDWCKWLYLVRNQDYQFNYWSFIVFKQWLKMIKFSCFRLSALPDRDKLFMPQFPSQTTLPTTAPPTDLQICHMGKSLIFILLVDVIKYSESQLNSLLKSLLNYQGWNQLRFNRSSVFFYRSQNVRWISGEKNCE